MGSSFAYNLHKFKTSTVAKLCCVSCMFYHRFLKKGISNAITCSVDMHTLSLGYPCCVKIDTFLWRKEQNTSYLSFIGCLHVSYSILRLLCHEWCRYIFAPLKCCLFTAWLGFSLQKTLAPYIFKWTSPLFTLWKNDQLFFKKDPLRFCSMLPWFLWKFH